MTTIALRAKVERSARPKNYTYSILSSLVVLAWVGPCLFSPPTSAAAASATSSSSASVEDPSRVVVVESSSESDSSDATPANNDGSVVSREAATATASSDPFEHERFPSYGTPAFVKTCGWASRTAPDAAPLPRWPCHLLVRPRPSTNEGIGEWVSEIASGFIFAVQTGCRIVLDYGPEVNIGTVLLPVDDRGWNWTVPEGFACDKKSRCQYVSGNSKDGRVMEMYGKNLGVWRKKDDPPPVAVPFYRFVYSSDVFDKLSAVLPSGFHPHVGLACGFNSLFKLPPTASEFVPHLFSDILPAVRQDPTALVIVLYIRTGRSDQIASAEKREGEERAKSMEANDGTTLSRTLGKGVVKCALKVEEERLLLTQSPAGDTCSEDSSAGGTCSRRRYERVVWTVISDSPNVGRIITKEYTRNNPVDPADPAATTADNGVGAVIPRRVVTTSTRGVHTRQQRWPSTSDFAEAFLDWWLLGESDAVIAGGEYSFGRTGALRTSRPLYAVNSKGECNKKEWV